MMPRLLPCVMVCCNADFNLPQLFAHLIADVFPNVDVVEIVYERLEQAIRSELEAQKLQPLDRQIRKILQL